MTTRRELNIDEIIRMYLLPGEPPIAAICAEHEIFPAQLYTVLRKQGVPLRKEVREGNNLEGANRPIGVVALTQEGAMVVVGHGDEKAAVKRLGRVERLTPGLVAAVVTDYEAHNLTPKQIAGIRGLTYSKVLEVLRDARVQVIPGRNKRKWKKIRNQILEAVRQKKSLQEIELEFGVPLSALRKLLSPEVTGVKWRRMNNIPVTYDALIEEILIRLRDELGTVGDGEGAEVKAQLRFPGM